MITQAWAAAVQAAAHRDLREEDAKTRELENEYKGVFLWGVVRPVVVCLCELVLQTQCIEAQIKCREIRRVARDLGEMFERARNPSRG